MAIVIDSTPLSPTCNSYVDESEIAAYVSDRISDSAVKTAWTGLTAELRATYLVNATRHLDSIATWIGLKYSRDQRLDWPRYDAVVDGYYVDNVTFPTPVKEAACELALWLMTNDGEISQGQDAAYDSIKIGPIAIDFNERVSGAKDKYFPDIVAYILRDYATLVDPSLPSANSVRIARLERA